MSSYNPNIKHNTKAVLFALFVVTLVYILTSCSANWHLQKAINKGAIVSTTDTTQLDSIDFIAQPPKVIIEKIPIIIGPDSTDYVELLLKCDSGQQKAFLNGKLIGQKKGQMLSKKEQAALQYYYQDQILKIRSYCNELDSVLQDKDTTIEYYKRLYLTQVNKNTQIDCPPKTWGFWQYLISSLILLLAIAITIWLIKRTPKTITHENK